MSIFSALRDVLRPPQPHKTSEEWTLPFGLTGEEWNSLKTLQTHPGFAIFLRALDVEAKLRGELLLQTSKDEALHFLRGSVAGLRKAATLIEEKRRDEIRHAKHHAQSEDARNRPADARATALYGSPGWRTNSYS